MRLPLPRSLTLRIMLAAIGIQLLVFGLGGWTLDRTMQRYAFAEFQRQLQPVEALLETALAPPLFSEDIGSLQHRAKEILAHSPLIEWLLIDDTQDRLLVRAGPAPDQEPAASGEIRAALATGHYVDALPIRIGGEPVGHAHVGLRLDALQDYLSEQRHALVAIGLSALLASSLLTALLVWWRTRQLRELGDAVDAVTQGR
ncbi:MAG: hypothetical protein D6720_03965, partial [Gammaproteobacteria bacterium]